MTLHEFWCDSLTGLWTYSVSFMLQYFILDMAEGLTFFSKRFTYLMRRFLNIKYGTIESTLNDIISTPQCYWLCQVLFCFTAEFIKFTARCSRIDLRTLSDSYTEFSFMLLKIVKAWKKDQSNCGNSWTRWSKIEKLDSTRKYFKLKWYTQEKFRLIPSKERNIKTRSAYPRVKNF